MLFSAKYVVSNALSDGLMPDPIMTIDEWANTYRVLPSGMKKEPGPYRTDRVPYLREIMQELSPSSTTEKVTLMKGHQIGGTEIINNFIGAIIHLFPGPILYVNPTLQLARDVSNRNIQTMIDCTPALSELVSDPRSRDSKNSILRKEFPCGELVMVGSNSGPSLRSMSAKYVLFDEMSAFEQDANSEGDPVSLAIKRSSTFKQNRKIFQVSTPKIKGMCRIEQEWNKSDQRYFHVPCPHCFKKNPIKWENIKWDKDEQGNHLPDTAYLYCEHCGAEIDECHKDWMLSQGEWIATTQGEPGHKGYHVSTLYAPNGWYSWSDAVREFLEAKKRADIGDVSALKVWTNNILGQTWVDKGTEVSPHQISSRVEDYPAEVPEGVSVLTAGIDVQQDRLEVGIYGWNSTEECYGIDYRIIWGDPSDLDSVCWRDLEDLLFRTTYKHQNGLDMRINAAGIDAGYLTTKVYEFCKMHSKQNLYCVMGEKSGAEGIPTVGRPSIKYTGRDKRPVNLWNIGTFDTKRLIYARLLLKQKGPGYIHFPKKECFDGEFFEQLTAERIVERMHKGFLKREFIKIRARNEGLDTLVYAYATLHIYRPNWIAIESHMSETTNDSSVVQKESVEQQQVITPQQYNPFKYKPSWRSNIRNKAFRG